MKIKELLSGESKWTKNLLAMDVKRNPVRPLNTKAVSWCLVGAIEKCYSLEEISYIGNKIYLEIDVKFFSPLTAIGIWNDNPDVEYAKAEAEDILLTAIGIWNDNPDRTFDEVKALVEKLDI